MTGTVLPAIHPLYHGRYPVPLLNNYLLVVPTS